MTRKTHAFSKKALINRTPTWAKNMFRITVLLTTAAAVFVAGTNLVSEDIKYEFTLGLKALDVIIYGISEMIGVETKED